MGARISGGQRQRIAIARALYHNPDILIFDEATSALDNRTEHDLITAINELMKDRTVVTITHKLANVSNYDRVYFLKDGRIADVGTYNDLVSRSGDFSTMARNQI